VVWLHARFAKQEGTRQLVKPIAMGVRLASTIVALVAHVPHANLADSRAGLQAQPAYIVRQANSSLTNLTHTVTRARLENGHMVRLEKLAAQRFQRPFRPRTQLRSLPSPRPLTQLPPQPQRLRPHQLRIRPPVQQHPRPQHAPLGTTVLAHRANHVPLGLSPPCTMHGAAWCARLGSFLLRSR
jgi:hypothetical protein